MRAWGVSWEGWAVFLWDKNNKKRSRQTFIRSPLLFSRLPLRGLSDPLILSAYLGIMNWVDTSFFLLSIYTQSVVMVLHPAACVCVCVCRCQHSYRVVLVHVDLWSSHLFLITVWGRGREGCRGSRGMVDRVTRHRTQHTQTTGFVCLSFLLCGLSHKLRAVHVQ